MRMSRQETWIHITSEEVIWIDARMFSPVKNMKKTLVMVTHDNSSCDHMLTRVYFILKMEKKNCGNIEDNRKQKCE